MKGEKKHEWNYDMVTSRCHQFVYGAIISAAYESKLDKCTTLNHLK